MNNDPFENDFTEDAFEQDFKEDQNIETSPEKQVTQSEALLKGVEQGATFGFADELAGAIGAGLEMLPGSSSSSDEELRKQGFILPDSPNYKTIRDEVRSEYKQAETQHPGTTIVGNVVGGVLTAPAAGLNAIKGATAGAKILNAAKMGGIAGATTGAGVSEAEDVLGLTKDVGTGAAIGATLGGVTEGVIGGTKAIGRTLSEKMPTTQRAFEKGKQGIITSSKEFAEDTSKKVTSVVDEITNAVQQRKEEINKINKQNVAKIEGKIDDITSDIKKEINTTKKLQTGLNEAQKVKFESKKGDLVKNIQQKFGEAKDEIGKSYDTIETQIPEDKQFSISQSLIKLEDDLLINGKSPIDATSMSQRFLGTQDPEKLSFSQLRDMRLKARELADSSDPALKRSYSNLLKNLNSDRTSTLTADDRTRELASQLSELDKRYAGVIDLENNYFGKVMFDQKTNQAFTDTLLKTNIPNKETLATVNKMLQNKALSSAETEELISKLNLVSPELKSSLEPKLFDLVTEGRQLENFTPTVQSIEEALSQNPELSKLQNLLQQYKIVPEAKSKTDRLMRMDEDQIRDYLKTALPELESPISAEKGRSNIEQVLEDFKTLTNKDIRPVAEEAVKDANLVREAAEPLRGALTPRSLGLLEGISQYPANIAGRVSGSVENTLYKYGSSAKNIFTDDITNVISNVRKVGTPEAEVYARQLESVVGKDEHSRNALLFSLMQQPQFRKLFQSHEEGK